MRKVLKLLLGLAVAGALLLAALPWWLGLALAPLARGQGVTFARYEYVGHARFRLHEVRREDRGARFAAAVIEADTPLLWGWRALRVSEPRVAVRDWSVEIAGGSPEPATATGPTGMAELHGRVGAMLDSLTRWLPNVELRRGAVSVAGLPAVTVQELDWRRGELRASGVRVAEHEIELSARRDEGNALTLNFRAPADDAALKLIWSGAVLEGAGTWNAQPLQLHAHFPDRGWIPTEAEVVAENWSLPAERVRLGERYAALTGGGRLVWRDTRFELTGDWQAVPKPDEKAPPMRARLAAHGDRAALTVGSLEVDAPFASAHLSAPVTVSLTGPFQAPPTQLTLRADLAQQSWFAANGVMEGTAEIRAAGGGSRVTFRLGCAGLEIAGVELRRAAVAGELNGPKLELRTIDISFDERSQLAGHASLDLQRRELGDTEVRGAVGPEWFRRWLPAGVEWASAEFSATLSGPLDAPLHQGHLAVTQLSMAPLRPLALTLDWRGRGAELDDCAATLAAGESSLRATGTVGTQDARLRELQWRRSGGEVLTLAAPARLEWAAGWRIDALQLKGPRGRVGVSATGGAGELAFNAEVTAFERAWLGDWVALPGPAWTVETLHAEGRTEGQALHFNAAAAGQVVLASGTAQVAVVAAGDGANVTIERCEIRDAAGPVVQAHGRVPLRCTLEKEPRLEWDRAGPLEGELESRPDSPFWAAVGAPFGVNVDAPHARLRLGGTLASPTGELELSARRVAMSDVSQAATLPTVENIALRAHADHDALILETFTASVEGQALQVRGRCPLGPAGWRQLLHAPSDFDWSAAEAQVELPAVDLRALAAHWDGFPVTQGELQLVVQLQRGLSLSGSLRLTDGTSRPIPSVGVLQQLTAELELQGHSVLVRELSAQLGGETATVTGAVDFTEPTAPRLDLKLSAKNLPLVRRAGLLLRSDLDLAVTTDAAGATRVGGSVNLRDSLVLADLRQWLPTGVRAAGRAPPYFAVTSAPFRDWRLEVAVGGPRGVRLHTPVLTGWASPRFQLEGTLGEPRAVGEVVLEEGRILFPFAAFRVQQGTVRLSRADPFHPQLRLDAAVRRYGYDLRLEGRGPVDQPILTFAAAPALTSEQVLLLVMAGQMPGDTASAITGDRKRLTALGAYLGRGFLGLGGDDAERLTISAGEQTTRQGAETYLVEYLLGERWSLIGEYDEFDDYNVGLRWRVYSQGGDDAAR